MDIKKITHLPYLLTAKRGSLFRAPKDDRDFQTGIFGWGDYKPKHLTWSIKYLSVKNQMPFNTCQWNATITAKELDEGVPLSVRGAVAWGVKNGLVSGDGFSNLRSGQMALKNYGAIEESILPEDINDWNKYINVDLDRFAVNAEKHKIQSFWNVSSRNDLFKLIDDGRPISTGIDWYTGFNRSMGFKAPWIVSKPVGYKIGGHAIDPCGYRFNYHSMTVVETQNSMGKEWGESGRFYIEVDYLLKNNYGFYTNLDVSADVGKFLNEYDGQNVKGSGPAIYFIQKGLKKAYPDELTYLAYNVADSDIKKWTQVDDEVLAKVKDGDNMDITKSLYWEFLRDISNEQRLAKLIELITRK